MQKMVVVQTYKTSNVEKSWWFDKSLSQLWGLCLLPCRVDSSVYIYEKCKSSGPTRLIQRLGLGRQSLKIRARGKTVCLYCTSQSARTFFLDLEGLKTGHEKCHVQYTCSAVKRACITLFPSTLLLIPLPTPSHFSGHILRLDHKLIKLYIDQESALLFLLSWPNLPQGRKWNF